MTDRTIQVGSVQLAKPLIIIIPTEIHQMILDSMASIGPQEAHTALLVGPQFKAGLAKYRYKRKTLEWYQVSLFWRERGKHHNALTIDFSVNNKDGVRIGIQTTSETRDAMVEDMSKLKEFGGLRGLENLPPSYITKWQLTAPNVVLKDYYTSYNYYSHEFSKVFRDSVVHLTCIESGRNKGGDLEFPLWLQVWYLDHTDGPPHVPNVFPNCKDLWIRLPRRFDERLGVKFEFPALEYLYVVIKLGSGSTHTMKKWLEHAKTADSLKSSTLKVAQVIQYNEQETPAERIKSWMECAKVAKDDALYKQTACIAMYCPDGETLNTIEGKAKIRAACKDQWYGEEAKRAAEEAKRAAEEVKVVGTSTKKQKRR